MRRIAVVTGSRADYGLFVPLLRLLKADPEIDLQLIVCAAHLAPEFGSTRSFIEADGFPIAATVEMLLSGDTPSAIIKSVGLGCIGFADVFARDRPDIVVLLGDRFETLAAAQAAMLAQIPIAHLHGGERTEGAVDEMIRHAITKMAHLHFVSADEFGRRVVQLGEDPTRVHNVGAIGLDNVTAIPAISRAELAEALGISLGSPLFLVTYHPVTLQQNQAALPALFDALSQWPQSSIVVTYANSDAAGRAINAQIRDFAASAPDRIVARPALGLSLYVNAMRHADCVIGNSSSGLIEAPTAGVPTVNIGPRQQGRLRGATVVDCGETADAIASAIRKALSEEFRNSIRTAANPYGQGGTAPKIHKILKSVNLAAMQIKVFHDLPQQPQV